jgi:signal transduction histidine kinase
MTLEKYTIDNKISIYIRDTGQVIDQNILQNISKFITKSKDGNRLRLYISKKILSKILVVSRYGQKTTKMDGAIFSFSLPLIYQ